MCCSAATPALLSEAMEATSLAAVEAAPAAAPAPVEAASATASSVTSAVGPARALLQRTCSSALHAAGSRQLPRAPAAAWPRGSQGTCGRCGPSPPPTGGALGHCCKHAGLLASCGRAVDKPPRCSRSAPQRPPQRTAACAARRMARRLGRVSDGAAFAAAAQLATRLGAESWGATKAAGAQEDLGGWHACRGGSQAPSFAAAAPPCPGTPRPKTTNGRASASRGWSRRGARWSRRALVGGKHPGGRLSC